MKKGPLNKKFFILVLFSYALSPAFGQKIPQNFKESEGLLSIKNEQDAFRVISQFWSERVFYKNQTYSEMIANLKAKENTLEDLFKEKHKGLVAERIAELDDAIKAYRLQLENHKNSPDKMYTLFNLALAYHQKAGISEDTIQAKESMVLAISNFKIIYEEAKGHALWEEATYLLGQIANEMGDKKLKTEMVRAIFNFDGKSEFSFRGCRDYGDELFKDQKYELAHEAFLRAEKKLDYLPAEELNQKAKSVYYRLAWSSYRIASFDDVERYIWTYLGDSYQVSLFGDELTDDLLALLSDIYVEEYSGEKILVSLAGKNSQHITELSTHLINGLLAQGDREKVRFILPYLAKKITQSLHYPRALSAIAEGYRRIDNLVAWREQMAALAFFLDESHIYFKTYGAYADECGLAKELAHQAAVYLAFYHYRLGIGLENRNQLDKSRLYLALLRNSSENSAAKMWAMLFAKSLYFSKDFRLAQNEFMVMRDKYSLSRTEISEILFYQISVADKLVRQNYAVSIKQESLSSHNEPDADFDKMILLESADFIAQKSEQTDLVLESLLLAASTMRDVQDFFSAIKLWRKVLMFAPILSFERNAAIRGIAQARVQIGNIFDTLVDVKEFLRLEEFSAKNLNLRNELISILQTTIYQHEDMLRNSGSYEEAGDFLVKHALEFPDELDAEQLLHSAVMHYQSEMLWTKVIETAKNYLALGFKEHAADITYLKGGAYEELLDIDSAKAEYLLILRKYPKFSKIKNCIAKLNQWFSLPEFRVERGDYFALRSDFAPTLTARFDDLEKAVQAYIDAGLFVPAIKVVTQMKGMARERRFSVRSKITAGFLALARQNLTEARAEILAALKELKYAGQKFSSPELKLVRTRAHMLMAKCNIDEFNAINIEGKNLKSAGIAMDIKREKFYQIERDLLAVIKIGEKPYFTEAQYLYATVAAHVAEGYSTLYYTSLGKVPLSRETTLLKEIEVFDTLSKRIHLENALLAQRKPSEFGDDSWVAQSLDVLNLNLNDISVGLSKSAYLGKPKDGVSGEEASKTQSEKKRQINEEVY